MSRKKASPRPERDFLLEVQPTEVSFLWRSWLVSLLSILVSFSTDGDAAVEFKRATSELVASEATMVLSEALGLWPFLVIREGIGWKWVTRCANNLNRPQKWAPFHIACNRLICDILKQKSHSHLQGRIVSCS